MLWALLSSFIGAAATTLLVIALPQRQRRWPRLADLTDFPAPQNVHAHAARRLGGIGIAIGILAGATSLRLEGILPAGLMWSMAAATLPPLVARLAEDVTESVGPRMRLLCAALSGILGAWLLGALLTHTGWAWFDACLAVPGMAWLLTTFTVAGVVNSFNIIDGMNGLASMFAMLAMAALAYIASRVGDTLVSGLALATLGASLGFFAWNYPRGLIFLGDGGAYLLGFSAVELGFVLLRRHHEISALAPLVVIAYPVMETVFSMYRRRARTADEPAGSHPPALAHLSAPDTLGQRLRQRDGAQARQFDDLALPLGAVGAIHRADGGLVERHRDARRDPGLLRRRLPLAVSPDRPLQDAALDAAHRPLPRPACAASGHERRAEPGAACGPGRRAGRREPEIHRAGREQRARP